MWTTRERWTCPGWAPILSTTPASPNRTNTEFVQVLGPDHLRMRVWERGSGETMACGTGACAVLVATVLNGKCGRSAHVDLLGGRLHIRWDEETGHVFMTGGAVTVFEGELIEE